MKITGKMSLGRLDKIIPKDYQSCTESFRNILVAKYRCYDTDEISGKSSMEWMQMLDEAMLCQSEINKAEQEIFDLMPGGAASRNGLGDD